MNINSQHGSMVSGTVETYADVSTVTFASGTKHVGMRTINHDGTQGLIRIYSGFGLFGNKYIITTIHNGVKYSPLHAPMLAQDTCCNVGFQGTGVCASGTGHSQYADLYSYTGLTLGGSDFTIECIGTFITQDTNLQLNWHSIFCWLSGQSYGNGAAELFGYETGVADYTSKITIYAAGGTGSATTYTVTNPCTAQHHFAVTYSHSAAKLYFFIDGTQIAAKSKTLTAAKRDFGFSFREGTCISFKISNVAKYTAAFTAPTGLSKDSNTLVYKGNSLIRDDGYSIGYPISFSGYTSTTATSEITAYSNGTSSGFVPIRYDLETPFSASNTSTSRGSVYTAGKQFMTMHNVYLGGTDFTIEFWIKPDSGNILSGTNAARFIVITRMNQDDNNFGTSIQFISGWKIASYACNLKIWSSSNLTTISGSTVLSAGAWHHIAFVYQKDSGKQSLYANGVLQGSRTYTIPEQTYNVNVMGDSVGRFQGKFTDLIISNVARWTAAFTKPTSAPATSTSTKVGVLGRYFYTY